MWRAKLKNNLVAAFPKAVVTIDVNCVVERLWELGHQFHKEGIADLKAQVRGI